MSGSGEGAVTRYVGLRGERAGRVEAGQRETERCITLVLDHHAERLPGVLETVRHLAAGARFTLASSVFTSVGFGTVRALIFGESSLFVPS